MTVEQDILSTLGMMMMAAREEPSFDQLWDILAHPTTMKRLLVDQSIDAGLRAMMECEYADLLDEENDDLWSNLQALIQYYKTDATGIKKGQQFWFTMAQIYGGPPTSFGQENSDIFWTGELRHDAPKLWPDTSSGYIYVTLDFVRAIHYATKSVIVGGWTNTQRHRLGLDRA